MNLKQMIEPDLPHMRNGNQDDPASISEVRLKAWHYSTVVECWGHCGDLSVTLAQSQIVCLPSYREELPKVLLEAAACGRSLIATDTPGCRESFAMVKNGLLVPLRDAASLANAIERLLADANLRYTTRPKGRRMVELEFYEATVAQQTLAVYPELCPP